MRGLLGRRPPGDVSLSDARALAGRYELVQVLGRGGMADVYRANDRVLARAVAVKLLRESAGDDVERRRFMAEARTLARLSHSGLVTLLDAGFGPGTAGHRTPASGETQPYLVMELVEGVTLAQRIEQGPLPLAAAATIGVQLAEALAYVHDNGIIHRDVKPGNVLLGADRRVKLADFGIARLLEGGPRHTLTGQAIGTAAYLAPEQVTAGPLSPATDVYSLGLVLLEAVTARREYAGPPTDAAIARLSRRPAVPADLPPSWRGLLRDMTATDPAARPDARTVAAVLRQQETGPIPATRPLTLDAATVPLLAASPTTRRPPLARAAARAAGAVQGLSASQRRALVALAAVVVLLIAVAVIGGRGDESSDIPPNTPTQLRDPLQRLHEAVEGEQ